MKSLGRKNSRHSLTFPVRLLELTLSTAAENLALDEALLVAAETDVDDVEVLRLWEPANYCVVVGRSSKLAAEVDVPACRADKIPILRRSSGGAAVVAGPGCLMYCLVLRQDARRRLNDVTAMHDYVLGRHVTALAPLVPGIERQGTSDLALAGRKFSGNSLRLRQRFLLYHGTFLCRLELTRVSRYLRMPSREPAYRAGRAHHEFLVNLDMQSAAIGMSLAAAWGAGRALETWPSQRVADLVRARYVRREWNEQM